MSDLSVDVLFLTWERPEYTQLSWRALLENTDWGLVRRVVVYDDASESGVFEDMERAVRDCPVPVLTYRSPTHQGSAVPAMNWYIERAEGSDWFAKIDSDIIVPPGWLGDLLGVTERHPEVDLLGSQPDFASAPVGGETLGYKRCDYIGGVGLMATGVFDDGPIGWERWFGFTGWQERRIDVVKGWVDPCLRLFSLDQLPFEPWLSLAAAYVARGWARHWDPYDPGEPVYWQWWLDAEKAKGRVWV